MTKEQSIFLMNIFADLLSYISKFSMPSQFIHTLAGFETSGKDVYTEMHSCLMQHKDRADYLASLKEICEELLSRETQENTLKAYHICIWLDRMLTYEDSVENKLSIYSLVPLRAHTYISIDALNDNYQKTGIWINPKLPIFKSTMYLNNGIEKEKPMANRDAFCGLNGEFHNISYCIWNKKHIIHNIIVPYEYSEFDGEDKSEGNLKVGFIPITDQTDLIIPDYKNIRDGKYELKKMYINCPKHESINTRL